jgi:hypothetical protein
LPDYYDYDDSIGPRGGLGGLDMMDANQGDHNCFSKFLLGWFAPDVVNEGAHDLSLEASDIEPSAVLLMPGNPVSDPFAEYFMVQHRRRRGNDVGLPNEGLLIWHVDARLSARGAFLYDNSFTDHKLIRLMEADGLEGIEQGWGAEAGDYYRPGDLFSADSVPGSGRYDGAPTNLVIDEISVAAAHADFQADLGSGCALYCEAEVAATAWPGGRTAFRGSAGPANCPGDASIHWRFGDGFETGAETSFRRFSVPGRYQWTMETALGEASCSRRGEILVCADERCWQWWEGRPMAGQRVMHAATVLSDGRVLVAGGESEPEIFDPESGVWSPAGTTSGTYRFVHGVLLQDGRVLLVGGAFEGGVSAEIYDPSTNTWRLTGQLTEPRMFHSALGLPDGRVLVAGGHYYDDGGNYHDHLAVEVFDPYTETWREVGVVSDPAILPGLTLLHDGRVLVTEKRTATIFDPVSESWTRVADLNYEREYHVSVTLVDGRVLVAGGFRTLAAEIFDPETGQWTLTEPMNGFHLAAAVATDSAGRVLVFGGFDQHSTVVSGVEVFDPETGEWLEAAPMARPRLAHTASRLADGKVLITGGMPTLDVLPYRGTTSAEIFGPPAVELTRRSAGRRVSP